MACQLGIRIVYKFLPDQEFSQLDDKIMGHIVCVMKNIFEVCIEICELSHFVFARCGLVCRSFGDDLCVAPFR